MEMPLNWHRRQAIVLASQLPDDPTDAILVLQALTELVDTFLVAGGGVERVAGLAANILPFTG